MWISRCCSRNALRRLPVLAAMLVSLLWASSASADGIFWFSDFSNFYNEWFDNGHVAVFQGEGNATILGTGLPAGHNAAASRIKITLSDVASGGIWMNVMDQRGDWRVKVVWFDELDQLIDPQGEVVFDTPFIGAQFRKFTGLDVPEEAVSFRLQLVFDGPSGLSIPGARATIDHMFVTSAPEPGTALLVGAGLGALAIARRRRA